MRFPEEGALLEELNDPGYDACKRLAALIEGAVDDECLDDYEGGSWLEDIDFARGDWANGKPPGFTWDEPRRARVRWCLRTSSPRPRVDVIS